MKPNNNLFARRAALAALFILSLTLAQAQQKQNLTVAIYLYPRVELLDFAGPGEVFASTAGFTVYTVSVDGKELVSQGFVTVKPQYSIENAPAPDLILFPGGHTSPTMEDQKVIDWLNRYVASGTIAMSVCSGAGVLAKAGLLTGLNVTTFHGYIPGLQAMLPHSKVLANTRYVDNGNVITTAGVSAGIDGALHVVARIKGNDVAKATAFYMEYDKWRPEEGRVDFSNEILGKLKMHPVQASKEVKLTGLSAEEKRLVPYEGELKNLGVDLLNKGLYADAAAVLETAIRWYPNSAALYSSLSLAYSKLGKSSPMDEEAFLKLVNTGNVDEAVKVFENTQKTYPGWKIFSEDGLNYSGYELLRTGDFSKAVKVFQLNAQAYPGSFNVFDSLGEGLMKAGNKAEAIANYKKSLELNPGNANAREMLAKLDGKM